MKNERTEVSYEQRVENFDQRIQRSDKLFKRFKRLGVGGLSIVTAVHILDWTRLHDFSDTDLGRIAVSGLLGGISLLTAAYFYIDAGASETEKQLLVIENKLANVNADIRRIEHQIDMATNGPIIDGEYQVITAEPLPPARIDLDKPRIRG